MSRSFFTIILRMLESFDLVSSCHTKNYIISFYNFRYEKRLEMAHKIERDTLYKIATTAIIENFPKLRGGLDLCPENLLFDVGMIKRSESAKDGENVRRTRPRGGVRKHSDPYQRTGRHSLDGNKLILLSTIFRQILEFVMENY